MTVTKLRLEDDLGQPPFLRSLTVVAENCGGTGMEVTMTTDAGVDAAELFWSRVQVGEPDECWPYVGNGSRGKYGHVRIWFDGQRDYAHRVAFRLAGEAIPPGHILMHECDVGECCNVVRHVRVGTIAENNAQRDQRNRRTPFLPHGVKHWSAKLGERDVAAVRQARELGVPAPALAKMYSVSLATIYNLWSGRHYAGEAA